MLSYFVGIVELVGFLVGVLYLVWCLVECCLFNFCSEVGVMFYFEFVLVDGVVLFVWEVGDFV